MLIFATVFELRMLLTHESPIFFPFCSLCSDHNNEKLLICILNQHSPLKSILELKSSDAFIIFYKRNKADYGDGLTT